MTLGLIFSLLAVAGVCRAPYAGRREARYAGGILYAAIAVALAWQFFPVDYAT
ncbi:hypothetical protein Aph01nite_32830 [Acrocarpospora phusangensis]|uniref:Uncharacterized protein n=1 Tax=Acrocarpospora phusangensis TaxID=1070424 RepID=A0A919QCM7_9ACTN|nr:hypothetical protein [Acrocarpospora phusangensis]GIH24973.1 hypothetical protein Aph01nite_32830 [Acrocarpospora phusangensis]